MNIRKAMKINRNLLPVKGTYFCVLGGVASLLPYLGVYMKQIGLSASESAIIYGTMPFLGAFVRTLVGAIADKLQKHKATLFICCLLSGLFHGFLLLVPSRYVSNGSNAGVDITLKCSSPPLFELCIPDECRGQNPDFVNGTHCEISCCEASFCLSKSGVSDCFTHNATHCEAIHVNSMQLDSFQYAAANQTCFSYSLMNKFHYDQHPYTSLTCNSSSLCSMRCPQEVIPESLGKCLSDNPPPSTRKFERTFWMFFTLCLIGQMFFAPIFSLIDAMTYDYLGDQYSKWGQQRLWGTVGFAVFAVASGLIMDIYNTGTEGKDYTFSFIAFAVLNILASILVFTYRISSNFTCKQIFKNMGTLLRSLDVLLLLMAMIVFGIYTGLIEVFLFWHLSLLGGSQLLNGLCILVNCIPEAFVLIFAGAIISRIGHVNCLHLAMLAYGVRLVAYSFLSNPWVVLAIEPLQALCFGLMYAAASSYANLITPHGMSGTIQGIIGALYFGAGKGIGSVVGGIIFEKYHAVVTFRSYGISAFIFLVIFFLVHRFVIRPQKAALEEERGTEAAGNLKAQEDEDEDESAGKMVIEEMQA